MQPGPDEIHKKFYVLEKNLEGFSKKVRELQEKASL